MSDHARDAVALWVVHTYLLDSFQITPRLAIRSPVKRCGKTTLLDVIARLIFRPLASANATASAVFRTIEAYRPTLSIDEAAFLRDHDDLRRVLHSGHRVGGAALLTVGEDHEPRLFKTYAAVAVALIGKLTDELADRSVTVDLKRRLASESITPFRLDRTAHLDVLARKTARWAADNAERVRDTDPKMPAGLFNRDADNWRPLLAIAEVVGGNWPEQAREDAALCCKVAGVEDAGQLELLLGDIRDIIGAKTEMSSADLVKSLVAIEGHTWAEMGKGRKPLTQNRLARMLKPLGIAPDNVGPEDARVRGYRMEWFKEAFDRYLEPVPEAPPTKTAPQGASKVHRCTECEEIRTSEVSKVHSPENDCALSKCEKSNNDGLLGGCAVAKGGNGEEAPRQVQPRTVDGYELMGAEPPGSPCALCSKTGTVYLIRDPLRGVRSEPLHEACAAAWFRRDEPGLSRVRIRELADWYSDEIHRRYCDDALDTAALDGELRTILRDEVAFPEHVEIEFERVMQVVFAPK